MKHSYEKLFKISVSISSLAECGLEHDFYIQAESPVLYILDVILNTSIPA